MLIEEQLNTILQDLEREVEECHVGRNPVQRERCTHHLERGNGWRGGGGRVDRGKGEWVGMEGEVGVEREGIRWRGGMGGDRVKRWMEGEGRGDGWRRT